MKKFNSALSLVFVLIMLMLCVTPMSYAEDMPADTQTETAQADEETSADTEEEADTETAESSDEEQEEATPVPLDSKEYNLFKALGMLPEGMEPNVGEAVTRAEFAYIMARVAGYPGSLWGTAEEFADVEESSYYREAIDWLSEREIIVGYAGDFRPGDNIIFNEAAVMAVKALGYYDAAEKLYGEYPNNARIMAEELDLFSGISGYSSTREMKAEDVFIFFKNLAETPIAALTLDAGGGFTLESDSELTLLYDNYDILQREGKMTDNGITALDGESGVAPGSVIVDGINLEISENFSGAEAMIGEYLEFWYDEEEEILLWAEADERRTDKITIPYDMLETEDESYSISNIVYLTENGRVKNAEISMTVNLIYNEVAHPYFGLDDLKPESGYIVLIDDNSDEVYDTVKVTEYEDHIIMSVNTAGEEIFAEGFSFKLDDWDRVDITDANGAAAGLDTIAANTPVSIVMSQDQKTYAKIINCSALSVAGMIASYTNESSDPVWVIDGVEYKPAKKLIDEINSGERRMVEAMTRHTFYLNPDGDITGFTIISGSSEWYDGYLYGINVVDETGEYQMLAKIVMSDQTAIRVYFKDKFKLNDKGISVENAMQSEDLFRFTLDENGETVRIPKRMPIRFRLDAWEEINAIYTPEDITEASYSYDEDVFSLDKYYASAAYKAEYVKAIAGIYLLTNSTLIINDPYAGTNEINNDTSEIMFLTVDDLAGTEGLEGCYLYELDSNMNVGILVFRDFPGTSGASFSDSLLTVDKIYTMLDEDDQPIEVMDCVVYGASETYEPYDDSVDFSGLKQGDVLNFRLQDGKIIQYEKLCSLSEPFEPTYIEASSGIQNSRRSIIYAPLVSVSSTGFVIVGPEGRPSNNEPEYDLIGNSFNNNSTRVTVYNVRERTVKPGSPASIYANAVPDSRGNISVNDTTTRVLLRRRWGYAAEVVFVIY